MSIALNGAEFDTPHRSSRGTPDSMAAAKKLQRKTISRSFFLYSCIPS